MAKFSNIMRVGFVACTSLLLLVITACTLKLDEQFTVTPLPSVSVFTAEITSVPSRTPKATRMALTFMSTTTPTTTSIPTAATVMSFTTHHISTEYLREVVWSVQKKAFILTTWAEGNGRWVLSPTAQTLENLASTPALDPAISQEIGLYEAATYAISNNGQAILYHHKGAASIELWYADLNSHQQYQVMTSTGVYEGGCCIEDILWSHQDQEALLIQTAGESLVVRRLDLATRQVVPWSDGVTTISPVPVEDIVPKLVTLAPSKTRLAIVSSILGPQPDQLWILDLMTRQITPVGPAFAGIQPLWSDNERYVYYACGIAPHYFGAYDQENLVGIYKFDREITQATMLLPPGSLGIGEIAPHWSISDDEKYVVYGVVSDREDASREGIWLADLN